VEQLRFTLRVKVMGVTNGDTSDWEWDKDVRSREWTDQNGR